MTKITPDEISLFSRYIFDISGIHIGKDKGYLLETRFGPLLGLSSCRTYSELYQKAKASPGGDLEKALIDAISTNETFFFRDNTPFELLKNKIIPELVDRRCRQYPNIPTPIRIWSAACSTGQEVYSIAITLLEMLPDVNRYDISILGTDISNKALAQASYGQYNQFEVGRGMPENLLRKYFTKMGSNWRIQDKVRSLAKFEHLNLMQDFGNIGRFDVIFCRNVAIYFNQPDKVNLFKKLARNLAPDGALLVGGSETLRGFAPDFESQQYLRGIFYQLKGTEKELAAQDVRKNEGERPKTRKARVKPPPAPPKKKAAAPKTVSSPRKKPAKVNREIIPPAQKAEIIQSRKVEPDQFTPVTNEVEKPETIKSHRTLFEAIEGRSSTGEKGSLLASKAVKKNGGNPLLAGGEKKDTGKKSLLDRLRQKKTE